MSRQPLAPWIPNARIWLCVEIADPLSPESILTRRVTVSGDTGDAGFNEPFQAGWCEFNGRHHYPNCGWYKLTPEKPPWWRVLDLRYRSNTRLVKA